jgi:hypothetical protein
VVQHLHVEAQRTAGNGLADAAHADDAQGGTMDVGADELS